MKKIKLLILIVSTAILVSCSNSGAEPDAYYGTWANSEQIITITKEGKTGYYVCIKFLSNGDLACWDCFSYKDGDLGINGSSAITISNGKLIYKGDEYKKTE